MDSVPTMCDFYPVDQVRAEVAFVTFRNLIAERRHLNHPMKTSARLCEARLG